MKADEGEDGSEGANAGSGGELGSQELQPRRRINLWHITFIVAALDAGEVKEEEEDGMEWEDVGGSCELGSQELQGQNLAPDELDNEGKPLPAWRVRMRRRQRFWSQSHGFKVGALDKARFCRFPSQQGAHGLEALDLCSGHPASGLFCIWPIRLLLPCQVLLLQVSLDIVQSSPAPRFKCDMRRLWSCLPHGRRQLAECGKKPRLTAIAS